MFNCSSEFINYNSYHSSWEFDTSDQLLNLTADAWGVDDLPLNSSSHEILHWFTTANEGMIASRFSATRNCENTRTGKWVRKLSPSACNACEKFFVKPSHSLHHPNTNEDLITLKYLRHHTLKFQYLEPCQYLQRSKNLKIIIYIFPFGHSPHNSIIRCNNKRYANFQHIMLVWVWLAKEGTPVIPPLQKWLVESRKSSSRMTKSLSYSNAAFIIT